MNNQHLKLALAIIDNLYLNKEYNGAGQISSALQGHNLHISGENGVKRASEILSVDFKEVVIGGKKGRTFSKEAAIKIATYLLNTSSKERVADWYKLHPEEAEEYKLSRKKAAALRSNQIKENKLKSPYISYQDIHSELGINKNTFYKFCMILQINIIDTEKIGSNRTTHRLEILKTDYEKFKSYLLENFSSDAKVRARQMASITRIGNYEINSKKDKERKNKAILDLSNELGIECLSSEDACEYVCRANPTLIESMKLLNLPIYNVHGKNIYDIESLNKVIHFFNEKTAIKGAVSRAFEQKLISERYNFRCEKSYPDLFWKKQGQPLRFDYFLPDYNLLIEVQGMQHFVPSTMGANITQEEAIENFKDLQLRDKLKREYCTKNNINYIEIIDKKDFDKFDNFIKNYK